ncbi:hypothetical protein Y032_0070g409 [Ancylostoma ceylanicum]|uniref:MSP domain-containing protein n=1 Tax=Ancylostoma ceylanicum TaxID=53326 RepID=A0A016TYH3_9BILA|nr:hypothetical protein Y032_0070g409 [Ancylostoma ceylanicum]
MSSRSESPSPKEKSKPSKRTKAGAGESAQAPVIPNIIAAAESALAKVDMIPTKSVTFFPNEKRQQTYIVLSNNSDRKVMFKMKSTRPGVYKMKPVFGVVNPGEKYSIRLSYMGIKVGHRIPINDRITVVLASVAHKGGETDKEATEGEMKKRKIYILYKGVNDQVDPEAGGDAEKKPAVDKEQAARSAADHKAYMDGYDEGYKAAIIESRDSKASANPAEALERLQKSKGVGKEPKFEEGFKEGYKKAMELLKTTEKKEMKEEKSEPKETKTPPPPKEPVKEPVKEVVKEPAKETAKGTPKEPEKIAPKKEAAKVQSGRKSKQKSKPSKKSGKAPAKGKKVAKTPKKKSKVATKEVVKPATKEPVKEPAKPPPKAKPEGKTPKKMKSPPKEVAKEASKKEPPKEPAKAPVKEPAKTPEPKKEPEKVTEVRKELVKEIKKEEVKELKKEFDKAEKEKLSDGTNVTAFTPGGTDPSLGDPLKRKDIVHVGPTGKVRIILAVFRDLVDNPSEFQKQIVIIMYRDARVPENLLSRSGDEDDDDDVKGDMP